MIPFMDSTGTDIEQAQQANLAECQSWLPVRSEDSHKGSNGRVLIIGGEQAMAGAACLAAWSADVAGAGL
jgi:NAD(P)H-hydrate epimerase